MPTRDHTVAEQSKNHRYSTKHQVVIEAAPPRLVVAVPATAGATGTTARHGRCPAQRRPSVKTTVVADGGYRGTGLVIPHRREKGQTELPAWREEYNTSHRTVRGRVEHAFARMETWKILRDCRLKGDDVHQAMLGIARLHNLTLAD
ncbi:transposase family protein [Streptomyces sp. NPDC002784]